MKEVQIMYMLNSYFHNHSFNKNSWGDMVANCFPEEPTRGTNLKQLFCAEQLSLILS